MEYIHGLDICPTYQQYPWKKIDWPALKADPLKFRFIWIKAGEGTDWEGYAEGAKECAAGAASVGFEAINLYHFYLFQYMDNAGIWRVLSAKAQAGAFSLAYISAGIPIVHPMTDCEDPLIGQFLLWSDTASINQAIAFARKLNAHLRDYHQYITDVMDVRPDIYTGKWWLDKFVPLLANNGYAAEIEWMKLYKFILADYDGELNIPDYINSAQVIGWQEDSTPVPPVQGIPTGRVVPGDALDIDRWMRTEKEFEEWCGKPTEEKPVTETTDRAHFVIVSDEDKNINVPAICQSVNNLALKMVNQNVEGMIVHKDTGFPVWVDRATKPAIGVIEMDQDLFWKKEIDLNVFTNSDYRNMWNNETIKALFEQWRSVPIPESEWKAKHLNITASSGWHDIRALWILMRTTINPKHGEKIAGAWQFAIVDDLLKALTPLKAGGYIPNIPIFLMAPYNWYETYANDPGWVIKSRIEDGQLAGLGYMRLWGTGAEKPDLITDVAPMAIIADSVADFWQYDPVNYVPPFKLDYADYKFFVWSFNRLLAADMFYEGAAITPATAGSWLIPSEEVAKLLGTTVVTPPVEPPATDTVTIAKTEYADLLAKADKLAKIEAILEAA